MLSGGSSLTGNCNRTDMKITAADICMNPLGCWFDWQLSDVLTSADLDRVNTWY